MQTTVKCYLVTWATADLYWLTGDVKSGFEVRTGTLETSFSLPVLPCWTLEEKKWQLLNWTVYITIYTKYIRRNLRIWVANILYSNNRSILGYVNFKCQSVCKQLDSEVLKKKTTLISNCKNCSHSDLAGHWTDWRDLESHSQPLLFFAICLPRVFIKAIVKVIREIRSCKNTPTPQYTDVSQVSGKKVSKAGRGKENK